jgi:hypothetical protein
MADKGMGQGMPQGSMKKKSGEKKQSRQQGIKNERGSTGSNRRDRDMY